jgi:hypothetical protein
MGVEYFYITYEDIHLKHTSFYPSAEVKPISIDLVHAIPWQCRFALYVYNKISMVQ